MHRRSRGINVGLLMLLSQVFHIGINNIPPVTLATLALNVWLFLNPLKPLYYSCLSVEKCYQQKDWQRLLLSPLHHVDDWHLYFNMVSMLWKGIKLERRLGSRWFAYVITTFSLLTGLVYLLLQFALAEFMNQPDFRKSCAVGFSGVLFALKVLSNHYCPGGFVNVLGFPVPNRFACWAELLAIHFCSPGTSFAGHLAGILVGLMYTQGPLKKVMETCAGLFSSNAGYPGQQYYFNSAGPSGYQNHYPDGRLGAYEETHRNYDVYTAGLSEEEQLERALRASLWDRAMRSEMHTTGPSLHLSLRRWTLPHFSSGSVCGSPVSAPVVLGSLAGPLFSLYPLLTVFSKSFLAAGFEEEIPEMAQHPMGSDSRQKKK
ncbi:rhomboid-related protein 4 isoform X2 [Onychomys torridus]|uniref:rhomboid-related protein 4 isoform X2 n=1 Tax=Onychomys torridus TaxID=38674 RepID=UPI00167FA9F3|nr:rhomboid-related protein 4 isoform X2 [Onychomys torridus]